MRLLIVVFVGLCTLDVLFMYYPGVLLCRRRFVEFERIIRPRTLRFYTITSIHSLSRDPTFKDTIIRY